jgi:hypothetical protein
MHAAASLATVLHREGRVWIRSGPNHRVTVNMLPGDGEKCSQIDDFGRDKAVVNEGTTHVMVARRRERVLGWCIDESFLRF